MGERTKAQQDRIAQYKTIIAQQDTDVILTAIRQNRDQALDDDLVYEAMRDVATERLKESGGTYLVEIDGVKYRAVPKGGSSMVGDVDVLREEVSPEVFAEVTKVTVDNTKLAAAANAGRVSTATLTKVLREKPRAASVNFEPMSKPGEPE